LVSSCRPSAAASPTTAAPRLSFAVRRLVCRWRLRRISSPSRPPARSPACPRSADGAPVLSFRHSPAPPRSSSRSAGLPASRRFLQRFRPLHAPTGDVQIWLFQTRSDIFDRVSPLTRLACRLLASRRCSLGLRDAPAPARGLHAPASGLLSPARDLHAPLRRRFPPPPLLMGLGLRVFLVIFGLFLYFLGFEGFFGFVMFLRVFFVFLGFFQGFRFCWAWVGLWVFGLVGFRVFAPACGFGQRVLGSRVLHVGLGLEFWARGSCM